MLTMHSESHNQSIMKTFTTILLFLISLNLTGQTTLINDIIAGTGSSNPENLIEFQGKIFFSAYTPDSGKELWVTDGTPEGTSLLKDINPGVEGSSPDKFFHCDSIMLFRAITENEGSELWKTNGTPEGTQLLKNIESGFLNSLPSGFTSSNNIVFFQASTSNYGTELWRTDGTEAGTFLVKDIFESGSLSSNPQHLVDYNGTLLFIAQHSETGTELWKSDGTNEGTLLIKDIYPGSNSSDPYGLIVYDNFVYFSASEPTHGSSLWRTDGSEEGTIIFDEALAYSNYSLIMNGSLIFPSTEKFSNKRGLYKLDSSDGTVSHIKFFENIGVLFGTNNITREVFGRVFQDQIVFYGKDESHGYELWKTDGSTEGTSLIKDIYPGSEDSGNPSVTDIKVVDNIFYFVANNNENGFELWRSDGTENGTLLTTDLNEGQSNGGGYFFSSLNGELYFSGTSNLYGTEIFKYIFERFEQTINFESIPPKRFGDPDFNLVAESNSQLPISYSSSNNQVIMVDGEIAQIRGVGSVSITASHPGDLNWKAASVEQQITVDKGNQSINFNSLEPKTFGDDSFELIATSSSELPITFSSSDDSKASISNNLLTILGAGTVTIYADQIGNEHWNPATTNSQELIINKAQQVITFEELTSKTTDDESFILDGYSSSDLPLSYTSSNTSVATISGSTVSIIGAGITNITASQSGNSNFLPADDVIQPLEVSLTLSANSSSHKLLEIYPNPSANSIEISPVGTLLEGKEYDLSMYDLFGKKILTQPNIKGTQLIDISHLPTGLYILEINSDSHYQKQKISKY